MALEAMKTPAASSELAQSLTALIQSRHAQLLASAEQIVARVPGLGAYARADLEQLVTGFESLLIEALEGRSRDTWDLFINAVIPGMRANGATVPSLGAAVTSFATIMVGEFIPELAPALRLRAREWFAGFYAEYAAAVLERALSIETAPAGRPNAG